MGREDCNADCDEGTPTGDEEKLPDTKEETHRQRVRKESEKPLRCEGGGRHFNSRHVCAQLRQVNDEGLLKLVRSQHEAWKPVRPERAEPVAVSV